MSEEENIPEEETNDNKQLTTEKDLKSESEIINLKSEPQNMHAHHKNNWKDYLFEFLMLFLAVTTLL